MNVDPAVLEGVQVQVEPQLARPCRPTGCATTSCSRPFSVFVARVERHLDRVLDDGRGGGRRGRDGVARREPERGRERHAPRGSPATFAMKSAECCRRGARASQYNSSRCMPTAFLTGGTGFRRRPRRARARRARAGRCGCSRAIRRARRGPAAAGPPGRDRSRATSSDEATPRGRARAASTRSCTSRDSTRRVRSTDYREVNVARNRAAAAAAAAASAPDAHFVLVSSQAAAGPAQRRPARRRDEDPARPISWYGHLQARGRGGGRARAGTGPWTVLRPGVVYGPGDTGLVRLLPDGRVGLDPGAGGRDAHPAHRRRSGRPSRSRARRSRARTSSGGSGFLCDPGAGHAARAGRRDRAACRRGRPGSSAVPDVAGSRCSGLRETVLEAVTRRSRPFNADKAREILAGDWLCDGGPLRASPGPSGAPSPADGGPPGPWDWYRARRVAAGRRAL